MIKKKEKNKGYYNSGQLEIECNYKNGKWKRNINHMIIMDI